MSAWIEEEVTTVALCWKVERRDGVALGFTAHDRDLIIDGLIYRAAPGMLPSSISLSDGFDVDTLDISGALTADAIRAEDMAAGRWDGARVRLFAADWADPAAEPLLLARGELGDVEIRDRAFTAELRGPTALLDRPVVEQTSPECRAELGDARCRVDMGGRRRTGQIAELIDAVTIRLAGSWPAGDAHGYGRLRWLDGPNSGLTSAVLRSDGAKIILREAPPVASAAGERIELTEGCDKSLATCAGRFANAANFRGEPFLPGMDLLTRYPGA